MAAQTTSAQLIAIQQTLAEVRVQLENIARVITPPAQATKQRGKRGPRR